jgi:hypothetical protein
LQATEKTIFSNLPTQTDCGGDGFNLQIDAIDSWYEDLPLANVGKSTKSIYQALKQFNHCKADYKKRLYFLEKIHETIVNNTEILRRGNTGRKLPLTEKHQHIAVLIRELHKQIVIGYTTVLKDIVNCKLGFFCLKGKKKRALVTQRIIRHISFILLNDYQLYTAPAKGLWSMLHQLFLMAENKKYSNIKITDPSYQLISAATIKQTYLQILLLALADPYHMSQLHIATIFKQLEEWVQLADIFPDSSSEPKDDLYIDLSSDLHPGFKTSFQITDRTSSRVLDTSRLEYTNLIADIENSTNHSKDINTTLLRQLTLTWGISPTRQSDRHEVNKTLKVAIGINNTHYVLSGYNEPVWLIKESKEKHKGVQVREGSFSSNRFKSKTVESSFQTADVWDEIFQEHNNMDSSSQKINLDNDPNIIARNIEKGIHDWKIINISEEGYCLSWDHEIAINVNVGEIAALRKEEPDGTSYWSVGIIRWIKCMRNHAIQMGIQLLLPNAFPVTITKLGKTRENIKSRAIILTANLSRNQPKTLITSALGYVVNDKIMLEEDHPVENQMSLTRTKLTLLDTLELSAHFSRFKFTIFGQGNDFEKSKATGADKKKAQSLNGETEFDSLWDDL